MKRKNTHTYRPLVLISIILAMFMSAIEGTIVSTAMPEIVGDLGGFSLYSWVFSGYLLMNALTILIYGKLSDLFGRKPIFIFGIAVFLVGSTLCGFATSMKLLIIFRLIQGIGAGAVQPIATTIVGDLYTMEERANIQGYLSSVWGISAVTGPALGALFVEYFHWSWVFWMNIPLGILAIVGTLFFFHENIVKKKHSIDYKGASFLFIAIASLMIVLIEGGGAWSWGSFPVIGLSVVFILAAASFLKQEKQAVEPVVPLYIWKNPLIAIANSVSLTSGIVMIGLSSFLPTYVQAVMGKSAIIAGFTLTMMSVGWPIASTLTGRLIVKLGYRKLSIIGGFMLFFGGVMFVFLDPSKGPLWAAIGSFIIGLGMGLTSTTFIVSIQSSVKWKVRGVATASNMFMRMMGSAIGAAFLGGLLNSRLRLYFDNHHVADQISVDSANALLSQTEQVNLSDKMMNLLRDGLTLSIHTVFLGVLIFAFLSLMIVFFSPSKDNRSMQQASPGS